MTDRNLKILHLEDVATDAELVRRELTKANLQFETLLVSDKIDYVHALNNFAPDIILSDHSLPSFNSLEALKLMKERGLNIPFVLVTATMSEEFAVNTMKEGASDYILKDRMQRLPSAVINALEKYRIEAERQMADRELHLLFNTIDEAYFSIDVLQSKLIQVSPASQQVFGYAPHEFLADPNLWQQIIHPDDRHIEGENFKRLLLGKTLLSQYRIIHKNGAVKWLESKIIPGVDHEGQMVRIDGVTRDISERKDSEELIAQNQLRLEEASATQASILNALPPHIVLLDEKGKIVAVNESWKRLVLDNNLGMPNYGVKYSYVYLVEKATGAHTMDVEKIAAGIDEVMHGRKKEFSMEFSVPSAQHVKWFQLVVAPLASTSEQGVVVLHIDITDRKMAEASVVQSEANLRSVFENTDLAIVLLDSQFNIVSFNQNAKVLSIKNYKKKLKAGSSAYSYFPKDRKIAISQIRERMEKKEIVGYETSFVVDDGSLEWFEVKWMAVDNPDKEQAGVIMTLKDITSEKMADLERDKITADLIQRNKDLEQFTYIVSHNLRAPVANILGLANLMMNLEMGQADNEEALAALSNCAKSLDQVILDLNQILQVSSHGDARIEKVSITSVIDEIRKSISRIIENNHVSFQIDFEAMNHFVTIKSYLYSILQNLIVNAIKYQRADTTPVISLRSRLNGTKLVIYIADNGKGIDLAKYSGQLFGLYKRFDYSVEGKGMGLFMVKMQVESLGGSIEVQSTVNKGTEFKITFPMK